MATDRLTKIPNIPNVSEEAPSPLVTELLDICCLQQELARRDRDRLFDVAKASHLKVLTKEHF